MTMHSHSTNDTITHSETGDEVCTQAGLTNFAKIQKHQNELMNWLVDQADEKTQTVLPHPTAYAYIR